LSSAWRAILALDVAVRLRQGRQARERIVRDFSLDRLVENTRRALTTFAPDPHLRFDP